MCLPFSEVIKLDSIKSPADSLWKSIWDSFIFVADIHKSIMETVSEDELFWWNQLYEGWGSKPASCGKSFVN